MSAPGRFCDGETMLIRFTGGTLDVADLPDETTAYGITFPRNQWVNVDNAHALSKLKGHPLFEAMDEEADTVMVENVFDAPKPKRGRPRKVVADEAGE
jgi:hypothetical protein